MRYLTFGVALLALAVGYGSIEVQVDGNSTNRTQFCAGEQLTLVCINDTEAYTWTIPVLQSPDDIISVLSGNTMGNKGGFTATFVNTTTSTLEFEVNNAIDGITITCSQFNGRVNISAINMKVYDMTCPTISTNANSNFNGINVLLMNPSPMCVQGYSVSVTGGNEVRSANDTDNTVEILNLNLCIMYEIDVTVMFIQGSMQCNSVSVFFPEVIGNLSVTANGSVVSWLVESVHLMSCISGYRLTDGTFMMIMDVPSTESNFDIGNANDDECTIGSVTVTVLISNRATSISDTVTLCNVTTTTMSVKPSPTISTASTTETDSTTVIMPRGDSFPWWIIVVIVLVVVVTVLIIPIIICCWKWRQHQARARSKQAEASAQMMQYDEQEQVVKQQQADTHDFIPTYQDVSAIQRETVGPSNDVYTMVDKQKTKGSKKKSEKKDEVPMYSMVNKDKNSTDGNPEGLVYTEVSVQSSSKSSRSRPPPPPGVAQLDANEPVLYSTVETPQQRH